MEAEADTPLLFILFTRALAMSTPRGVPGEQLLKFAGTLSPEMPRP